MLAWQGLFCEALTEINPVTLTNNPPDTKYLSTRLPGASAPINILLVRVKRDPNSKQPSGATESRLR